MGTLVSAISWLSADLANRLLTITNFFPPNAVIILRLNSFVST